MEAIARQIANERRMLPNNFTSKSQEAIQIAQMLANENGQQAVEPIHLLAALAHQDDGIVVTIFQKMGAPMNDLRQNINHIIDSLPKNFGFGQAGMGQVLLSPMLAKVLQRASTTAKEFGDDYISTEHLLFFEKFCHVIGANFIRLSNLNHI